MLIFPFETEMHILQIAMEKKGKTIASLFQVKTCFSRESQGITAESSWWLTISLLNYSPVSPLCLACLLQYKAKTVPVKDIPVSRGALQATPVCPPLRVHS